VGRSWVDKLALCPQGHLASRAIMRSMSERRWVTLRNHRRVQIDERGRVVRGLPRAAAGVHVRDISSFMGELRELEAADCSRSAGEYAYDDRGGREVLRDRRGRAVSPRFSRVQEAVLALLEANPRLAEHVQENWGNDSQAYFLWLRGGRRGPKPTRSREDGRFDPVDELHGLAGRRRCSSILEAVYVVMPASRLWEDITPDRLWPLEESVGFPISPPEEALVRPVVREAVETCRTEKTYRTEDLVHRARTGRLPPRGVPF
jgi:hypothetical protein